MLQRLGMRLLAAFLALSFLTTIPACAPQRRGGEQEEKKDQKEDGKEQDKEKEEDKDKEKDEGGGGDKEKGSKEEEK